MVDDSRDDVGVAAGGEHLGHGGDVGSGEVLTKDEVRQAGATTEHGAHVGGFPRVEGA